MRARLPVVAEPLHPFGHRHRADVERHVGVQDVVVVELVELMEVFCRRRPDLDRVVVHRGTIATRRAAGLTVFSPSVTPSWSSHGCRPFCFDAVVLVDFLSSP